MASGQCSQELNLTTQGFAMFTTFLPEISSWTKGVEALTLDRVTLLGALTSFDRCFSAPPLGALPAEEGGEACWVGLLDRARRPSSS